MEYFLIGFLTLLLLYFALLIIKKMRERNAAKANVAWIKDFNPRFCIRSEHGIDTTLSGTKYDDRQTLLNKLLRTGQIKEGTTLLLIPDPKNKFDDTAIKVCTTDGRQIGWLPNSEWNDKIFNDLMVGRRWDGIVNKVLPPRHEYNFYNLLIILFQYNEKDIDTLSHNLH